MKVLLTARIDKKILDELSKKADAEKRTRSWLVNQILNVYFAIEKNKETA